MFNWIITFFKKLFGFVTLDPTIAVDTSPPPPEAPVVPGVEATPVVIPTVTLDEPVVSDEEALATLESTEEDLPKGVRLIDGERYFWSAITGWTKSPTTVPKQVDPLDISQGPPFAWNMAGQIGQPRHKPDDWTEKGPDYDKEAYNRKYFPDFYE